MRRLLSVLALGAFAAATAPASAATPAAATAALAGPVRWTGHVTEPTGAFEEMSFFMRKMPSCSTPVCDPFELTVPAGTGALLLEATGARATSIGYEVTDPSGQVTCVDDLDQANHREIDFENPQAGVWRIRTTGTGDFDYTASATLQAVAGGTGRTPAPAPATATALSVGVPSGRSAASLRRTHRLILPLTTTAPLAAVRATIVRRGTTKVLARASLAKLAARGGRLSFALPHGLARGAYVVRVTAEDAAGAAVTARRTVTVTR